MLRRQFLREKNSKAGSERLGRRYFDNKGLRELLQAEEKQMRDRKV